MYGMCNAHGVDEKIIKIFAEKTEKKRPFG
jgi:hypothetical protein